MNRPCQHPGKPTLGQLRILLARIGLSLGALLVTLAGLELGVRWWCPQSPGNPNPPPLLRGQLTLPGEHRLRSDEYQVTVQVNREGFVDREWPAGDSGTTRIALIGDSFVQAAQVSPGRGIGRVLETELENLGAGPVELFSMGVPGAGTATELGVLETYALPLDPDLVLLGFLVSNDVLNNHPLLDGKLDKPYFTLQDGRLLQLSEPGMAPWNVAGGFLWNRSHAWRLAWRSMSASWMARRKVALGKGIPMDLRVHDPAPDPTWEEAWRITRALLERFVAECRGSGVMVGVLLFPDCNEVSEVCRREAWERWPASRGWDFNAARSRAASMMEDLAPVMDLQPALAAAATEQALYFPRDGHWTEKGHRVAARAAAPFVWKLLRSQPGSLP